MKLYRTKEGVKLYPVCKWEPNQHKIYDANYRRYNYLNDLIDAGAPSDEIEKADQAFQEAQELIEVFNRYVIYGIVYAPYKDYLKIKDIIAAYNARH